MPRLWHAQTLLLQFLRSPNTLTHLILPIFRRSLEFSVTSLLPRSSNLSLVVLKPTLQGAQMQIGTCRFIATPFLGSLSLLALALSLGAQRNNSSSPFSVPRLNMSLSPTLQRILFEFIYYLLNFLLSFLLLYQLLYFVITKVLSISPKIPHSTVTPSTLTFISILTVKPYLTVISLYNIALLTTWLQISLQSRSLISNLRSSEAYSESSSPHPSWGGVSLSHHHCIRPFHLDHAHTYPFWICSSFSYTDTSVLLPPLRCKSHSHYSIMSLLTCSSTILFVSTSSKSGFPAFDKRRMVVAHRQIKCLRSTILKSMVIAGMPSGRVYICSLVGET